jgi:hypothetical protein
MYPGRSRQSEQKIQMSPILNDKSIAMIPAAHYATGLQLDGRVASQLHNLRQA